MSHNQSKELELNTLTVLGSQSNSGKIKFNCENNSHGVNLKGPPHSASASYTLTLPNDLGSNGQVLQTDGSGSTSWVDQSNAGSTYSIDLDKVTITTSNVTLATPTVNHEFYIVRNSNSAITITLPAATDVGAEFLYTFKVLGTGTVTIDPNSTEYIDHSGQATYSPAQYDSITLLCDGSNWYLV